MNLMRTYCDDNLINYIESDDFDMDKYEHFLEEYFHGDKNGITIHSLFPTNWNVVFYEKLLKEGKLDVDVALECIVKLVHDMPYQLTLYCKDEHVIRLARICIILGASTSKKMKLNKVDFNIRFGSEIETSEYIVKDSKYVEISFDEIFSLSRKKSLHRGDPVRLLYEIFDFMDKGVPMQRAFRVYRSKSIANELRILPENLFCPEFGKIRKKLLGIDDSKFCDV